MSLQEDRFGSVVRFSIKPQIDMRFKPNNIIGIIGEATEDHFKHYKDIETALKENKYSGKNTQDVLKDLQATGIDCEIVISSYMGNNGEKKQKIEKAISEMALCYKYFKIYPSFVISPGLTGKEYFDKLHGLCSKIKAIFTYELEKNTLSEIKTEVNTLKSNRCLVTFQKVTRSDKQERPLSAFLLATYIKEIMGELDFGNSPSNKRILGIEGVPLASEIDYWSGYKCDAQELRQAGVITAVHDRYYRIFGDGTLDEDYKFITRTLICDTLFKQVYEFQKELIDKKADIVLQMLSFEFRKMMERLKYHKVIINFDITLSDLNTTQTIMNGELYYDIKFQDVPVVRKITTHFKLVDEYSEDYINSFKVG